MPSGRQDGLDSGGVLRVCPVHYNSVDEIDESGHVGGGLVGGRKVVPWLMHRIVGWGSRELFVLSVITLGLGIGYLSYLLGLFLAAKSETKQNDQRNDPK